MKHVRHLLVAALTVFLAAVLAVPAFAATGTITITPPAGTSSDATNTYKIYKVFDGVAGANETISYTIKSGKNGVPNVATFIADDNGTVYHYSGQYATKDTQGAIPIAVNSETKYIVPTSGELTAAEITAIAAYVNEQDLVDTATSTGTANAVSKALDNGFYYITTSTGTVVTIDSTTPTATVKDKNTVPGLDKQITDTDHSDDGMAGSIDADGKKALAELGKEVEYTATITVGKGCKGYEFHDKMGTGLTFKGNASVEVTATPAISISDWYEIKETPDAGDTLTITFADGIAENTVITIKYVGTVNSDALTVNTGKNTARVDYGDENSNNHTPDSTTNVYNAKFTVTKKDGDGAALAGAGFVIKNADNKYYKVENNVVSWVDDIDDATEHTSVEQTGVVPAFTGLVDGTYTLVEKTVPAGFNKAADSTFTIAKGDYTSQNLEQAAEVINNKGTELPSTGGMGTTILYIVGGGMVIAGIVMFLTKRRMASIEK